MVGVYGTCGFFANQIRMKYLQQEFLFSIGNCKFRVILDSQSSLFANLGIQITRKMFNFSGHIRETLFTNRVHHTTHTY